jgi:hypothetical protein
MGCEVDVDGSRITVALQGRSCPPPPECPAICELPSATCALPPLSAGSYEVHIAGSAHARALVVREDATATSCELPPGDPPSLDLSGYDRRCNDEEDCILATDGVPTASCQGCGGCPTTAIAAAESDRYEADLRAFGSLCEDRPGPAPACGPCPPTKAVCSGGTCAMVPDDG